MNYSSALTATIIFALGGAMTSCWKWERQSLGQSDHVGEVIKEMRGVANSERSRLRQSEEANTKVSADTMKLHSQGLIALLQQRGGAWLPKEVIVALYSDRSFRAITTWNDKDLSVKDGKYDGILEQKIRSVRPETIDRKYTESLGGPETVLIIFDRNTGSLMSFIAPIRHNDDMRVNTVNVESICDLVIGLTK